MILDKASMQFSLDETKYVDDTLEAYERLIRDAMAGDHTLFTSARDMERLWESLGAPTRESAVRAALPAWLLGTGLDRRPDRPAQLATALRAPLAREAAG